MPNQSSNFFKRLFYNRWLFRIICYLLNIIATRVLFCDKLLFWLLTIIYIKYFDYISRNKDIKYFHNQKVIKNKNDDGTTTNNDDDNDVVDWENPKIVSRNKRFPHTILRSFRSIESALQFWEKGGQLNDQVKTCNVMYLTGLPGEPDPTNAWKFLLIGKPSHAPSNWTLPEYSDCKMWDNIALPGHWQLQGYDMPIYTNTVYPFRFDPPRARRDGPWSTTECDTFLGGTPAGAPICEEVGENATGLYRRSFSVPSDWNPQPLSSSLDESIKGTSSKDRIFLVFEGVDSAFQVYVDGIFVGYSQDSCLPAEFDITDIICSGENSVGVSEHTLSCMVMRW